MTLWLAARSRRHVPPAPETSCSLAASFPGDRPYCSMQRVNSLDQCCSLRRPKIFSGTPDRHRAPRVPGPDAGLWRGTPAANSFFLWGVLQRGSHALIAEQGCAGFARCSGRWPHSLPADPGRIAPSIRPDLISGRHRQLFLKSCSKPERPKIALVGTPCPYQKPHPGLKRDEQHVGYLETHAHPA